MPDIPLSQIYVDHADRIRFETYGDIPGLAESLVKHGQFQPILVRNFDGDVPFKLVEGGRRYTAAELIYNAEKTIIPGVEDGCLDCKISDFEDDMLALQAEYLSNELREDFSWRERARFIERIHTGYMDLEEDWSVKATATVLRMSEPSVYKYLQVIADKEIFNAPEVARADGFVTAMKQADILRAKKSREMVVALAKKKGLSLGKKTGEDSLLIDSDGNNVQVEAQVESWGELSDDIFELSKNEPLEEWLPKFGPEALAWVHWDPPYGGKQSGGAFGAHADIDDEYETGKSILELGIPLIYRVLRSGHWLALWHHPSFESEISLFLQGHIRDENGLHCRYCEKAWPTRDDPYSLANGCPGGEWAFWVNPYPNIWFKQGRESDGHEIKRFLTNQYEQFFFACKIGSSNNDPILPKTNRGNVFVCPPVSQSERRHTMHKPWQLLAEIVETISFPGEPGADPSSGSGSIYEAGVFTGRPTLGCEKDRDYWLAGCFAYSEAVRLRDLERIEIPEG
jgi:ParB-like chromosome segregation protein Spo0J